MFNIIYGLYRPYVKHFYHLMDTEWRKNPFANMFEVMILQNMYFFGQ